MSNLNPGGLTRVLNYIKTWVTGLLNDKANSSHTHTKSQITDFPTIPSSTSQLTNDSGYITSSGSCNYANSAGKADYLGDIGSTDRNGASGTGWYSVGFSYSYDEGHNELAINNYWGIRLNCRDSDHVTINGNRIIDSANIGSQSVNYANSSGNADTVDGSHAWQMQTLAASGGVHGSNDWLMQCQHNVDGDGYFKLYCGDKSVGTKVDRANSAGYADSAGWANSAGGVAWGNVSDRPWAVSQFTNDSGFITSWSLMYINGDRAHNAYRIVYGSFNNWNNVSTGRCWVSFPNAFSSTPVVMMNVNNPDGLYNYQVSDTTTTGFIAEIWDGSGNRTGNGVAATYIAIGRS